MLSRCSVRVQTHRKFLSFLDFKYLAKPPPSSLRYSSSNQPKHSPASSAIGVKELVQRDIRHAERLGVLEPAPADVNGFQKLIHSAIQLGKFYFRGAKLIYTRGREVSAIKARARAGGLPITREESRLIILQRRDVTKLIPFVVMAIVLEELIPVAAIYAPFMLPSTCILPGQRARIEEKKTQKAITSAFEAQGILANVTQNAVDGTLPYSALRGTGSATVVCGLLRLPTFGNDLLRTWRIRRHLHFIQNDDRLLIQNKLEDDLSDHDVAQALEERGFIVQDLPIESQRARLKWWLNSVQDTPDSAAITRRLFLLTEPKTQKT
ncbi:hypothetical protein J3R30DRAFT_1686968 [Lentinula aciculospora]|uniref:Letm1 RBD domain-containing protein n=1 Tax=Lentinula aciculospora TaxID=153920 RepID=A0A9W8ZWN2_9AGAR|nr:hypothetical protein J3R30DRAFT_1686968 [Lentinula aciculospora]